jgi:16S rRNA processing protein RimM
MLSISSSFLLTSTRCSTLLELSASVNDETATKPARRRKKNKYQEFSKVIAEQDPLDALMEDSKQKIQQIELEQEKKKPPRPIIPPSSALVFPNNKEIDPYDPTSFGYLEIGTITGPHGVYGWLKLRSSTDFGKERLCTPGLRHLRPFRKRAPRPIVLLNGRHRQGDEYLIQLEDISDRDQAAKLRGSVLYVREEDRVETSKEEYIVSDLVGLDVYLEHNSTHNTGNGSAENVDNTATTGQSNLFVGSVAGVVLAEDMCSIPGLGHDMLEIILPRGRNGVPSLRDERVLIPMVPQIVTRVEIRDRMIYIDPPSGLLDLTYVREVKVRIKGLLPPARSSTKA